MDANRAQVNEPLRASTSQSFSKTPCGGNIASIKRLGCLFVGATFAVGFASEMNNRIKTTGKNILIKPAFKILNKALDALTGKALIRAHQSRYLKTSFNENLTKFLADKS